jgi:rhomboid protease GluP
MKQFNTKFKLIFVPFLFISVATVCVYTFLHWLLFIKGQVFPVDEEILNLFAPMVVPAIPILIWLRPRIKLLDLKSKGKDPLLGYIMFAWMAMLAPTVVAQEYLVTATGKLTKLDQISQINRRPETKYYSVSHFYIDKRLVAVKPGFEVSGKYNQYFDMTLYAPCPIFDYDHSAGAVQRPPVVLPGNTSPENTQNPHMEMPDSLKKALIVVNGQIVTKGDFSAITRKSIKSIDVIKGTAAVAIYGNAARFGAVLIQTKNLPVITGTQSQPDANANVTPVAWLALKYQKTISNKLSSDEKQSTYKEFAQECQSDFNSKQLDKFVYLDRIGPSSDLKHYRAAVNAKNNSTLSNPVPILSPVNEPFEARNGNKFAWIFGAFGIGSAVFLIMLLFKPLKADADVDTIEADDNSSTIKELKSYFLPREGFYITPIIIDINLAVFIVMAFAGLGFISFHAVDLLKYGANFRPYVNKGEYWRLLTNIFLHGGIMHILFNMYGLLFVGIFLEPIMGRAKYAFAYQGTGIAASLASIWWHPATISVGASGAIFGMYGIFLALLTTNIFPKEFKKSFLISTSIFVVYNLVFGLTGGIDNAAHIGGLLSGLLCGYAMYPAIKNKLNEKEAEKETNRLFSEFNNKP